jgi:formyltetrahydrofolate-dependent phosphoribosylglycinamide formyltransferase
MTNPTDHPLRLGVLLSGGGRTMLNLQEQIDAGELPAEIVTVIASRPCKGLDRAAERGLDTHLVNYRDFGPERLEEYSAVITAHLDLARVELVVMAGFLSKWIIPESYAGRVMNIHPALLPKFGGQGMFGHHVHEAVLAAGETVSGCTVHFVNNRYDAGPIILQRSVPVEPGDTPDDLADRVFAEECIAYPQAIRRYAAGQID